ncbi:sensor histidine kinase [Candidatus Korobacter versatilis]|uniref:sensor histidine kinase n=1 Tax=Candidatus Korobacter versatilis TaxID=658062 RepID=UPI001E44A082|nr:ATP-binding protein [Candidatus Koribacter versatilis]
MLVAEETLTLPEITAWAAQVALQPSWSDFPIILLTMSGEVDEESQRRSLLRKPLGNVVLLERPARPETLVSTVQAALRSRRRQYQMRDYLAVQRLAEEALRKSEKLAVVGRLAASMAHEINNPLASVTNLLYLMGQSGSLWECQEYAQTAGRELARVSEIVTQTLRIYHQTGRPELVSPAEIVNSALNLFRARLTAAQIVVQTDFRECRPVLAMGAELRQLILNMIGNALDAMRTGGMLKIRVAASSERSNGSRPGVRVTIADSGSGIHPAIKEQLFEPFVSTKGDTGAGLGLWVSSEIVRKHSGKIQVRSSVSPPAAGTVFSIFLPERPHFESRVFFARAV